MSDKWKPFETSYDPMGKALRDLSQKFSTRRPGIIPTGGYDRVFTPEWRTKTLTAGDRIESKLWQQSLGPGGRMPGQTPIVPASGGLRRYGL